MLINEKLVDGIYLVESDTKFIWKCNGIFRNNLELFNIPTI